ncbi:MAG: hypothetical protein HY547_04780 [Elusimicrobia bacterium]|nr:hypothetical protein [Elusimicrobiota bacterium]
MKNMERLLKRGDIPFCAGIFLSIAAVFLEPLCAREKGSASFRDTRNAVSAGGTRQSAASFREDAAWGQISATTYTSTSFRHRGGLLAGYSYPDTIRNLAITTGPWAGSIRLTFTSPGADGSVGNASSYVLKTAAAAIVDQTGFNDGTTYSQSWTPLAQGGSEAFTATGFTRDADLYARIEARDGDGNQAYYSNLASTKTPATLVSITVSPGTYNFGSQPLGTNVVATTSFTVSNDGNVRETYSLRATTNTADTLWFLGTSTSNVDEVVLRAVFHATEPMTSSFQTDDNLEYGNLASNSTRFSADGSTTGVNVDIFEIRNLWSNLRLPGISRTTDTQAFQITITAQEEP